ncbi:MAG: sulfite exporter TauE/SafE family protein [Clostridiales bacterium]|nr:sulfite exporter TauE/SafE family protein [Clostridiales bacterium]
MIWWIAATVCAFFVKGLCGFANTLVFTTIMSFGVSNRNISPVELLLGYPTNAIMAYRERRSIDPKLCLPLSGLVVLGSIPGMLLLKNADTGAVKLLFGVVIVLLGVEMLLRERESARARESKAALAVIGLLSGVLCGLYGVGALLGAYISRVTRDAGAFRANICVVFFVENTLRILLYSASGILNAGMALQAARLLPFALLGLFLGAKSGAVLDEKTVKRIVIVMLIVSGLSLIIGQMG